MSAALNSDVVTASDAGEIASPEAAAPEKAATLRSRLLERLSAAYVAVPLLLILSGSAFLINLGGYPFYTKGEPREAVTVYDIVHGGGAILPLRAGVEIPSKPLLMHWCAALISLAAGHVDEWTVRLPSAIFAILGMLACYLYVRRLFGPVEGLASALILGTTLQYLQAGSGARVDMTLTFFMEVAFFEFLLMAEGLARRRMLFYGAMAAATLTKGPVGIALPAATALLWTIAQGRLAFWRDARLARGLLLIAVIAGGWYLAASIEGGMAFVRKQVLAENIFTFLESAKYSGGHAHPFYYVELSLLAGFFPWSILFLFAIIHAARNLNLRSPRLTYLAVWIAVVLIFYSLAHSKRGVYLLAMYPAIAASLGVFIAGLMNDEDRTWSMATAKISGTFFLFAGAAALLAEAAIRYWPQPLAWILARQGVTAAGLIPTLTARFEAHEVSAVLIAGTIAALGSYLLRSRTSIQKTVLGLALGTAMLTLIANVFVVPAIADTLTLKQFTAEAMKSIGNSSIGYLGAMDYGVAFYSRKTIPVVSSTDPKLPDYLLLWSDVYEKLPPSEKSKFEARLKSGPTDLDGSGGMVLLKTKSASP